MSERMAGPLMPVIGGKVVLTALRESDIDRVAVHRSKGPLPRLVTPGRR